MGTLHQERLWTESRNATLHTSQRSAASAPFTPSEPGFNVSGMTDSDRIEALLNIVDGTRTENRDESEKLVVLGFAERRGKSGFWPTNAGWNLMGDRGRAFDNI